MSGVVKWVPCLCWFLFLSITATSGSQLASCESVVEVSTPSGNLNGCHRGGVDAFLSIPYALPPVESRRWLEPQPFPPWTGARDALAPPPGCPQPGTSPEFTQSEDCLYLNVYTPNTQGNTSVMVFIHGGSFATGASSQLLYNASTLASTTDTVIVTINYRLGVFGHLSHPDLYNQSEAKGNFALLDMTLALSWVQKNIAAFGGNPGSVTVFGQSSGGEAIGLLLLSPQTKNLFHGAILESGVGSRVNTLSNATQFAEALIHELKCNVSSPNSSLVRQCMEQVNASHVVSVAVQMCDSLKNYPGSGNCWVPVLDGSFLPAQPYDIMSSGSFHKVPLLVGSAKNDSNILLWLSEDEKTNMTINDVRSYINVQLQLEEAVVESIMEEYEDVFESYSPFLALSLLRTHYKYSCNAYRLLHAFANTSSSPMSSSSPSSSFASSSTAPVALFWYEWDHVPSFQPPSYPVGVLGATHATELPFIWHHPCYLSCSNYESNFTAVEEELSSAMMSFWTNFAKKAQPAMLWPVFNETSPYSARISTDAASSGFLTSSKAFYDESRCAFWSSIQPPLAN